MHNTCRIGVLSPGSENLLFKAVAGVCQDSD